MTHGASTRQPVYGGNRRIPGLFQRTLLDGSSVYEVSARFGGRMRRHRLQAVTKTDAIAEARALRVDFERGESHRSPATALTVAEVSGDWLSNLDARIGVQDARRRYSARTVGLYQQRLGRWIVPELGQRPIAELTVADVRRLVDGLSSAGLAPSTVTGVVGILSGLCRFAVKSGQLERNPVRDLDRDDRPGVARLTEPRYLAVPELDSLLDKLTPTFRPVVATCTYAALRISEALGLRWRDVDFAAETLTVSGQLGTDGERVPVKSEASAAMVPMLPALARELRDHRSRQVSFDLRRVHADALVFQTSRGRPQSRRNALRAVHSAGDATGLNSDGRQPVGLHDLRHSFVALALVSNVTLAEVAALARHANAKVTAQVYAGITEQGREVAAAKLVEAGFGR